MSGTQLQQRLEELSPSFAPKYIERCVVYLCTYTRMLIDQPWERRHRLSTLCYLLHRLRMVLADISKFMDLFDGLSNLFKAPDENTPAILDGSCKHSVLGRLPDRALSFGAIRSGVTFVGLCGLMLYTMCPIIIMVISTYPNKQVCVKPGFVLCLSCSSTFFSLHTCVDSCVARNISQRGDYNVACKNFDHAPSLL